MTLIRWQIVGNTFDINQSQGRMWAGVWNWTFKMFPQLCVRWHTASANQRPVSVPLWPMRGRDSVSFVTPALAIISHFPIPAFVSHLNRDPIKSHGHYLLSIGELSITRLFRKGGGAFLPQLKSQESSGKKLGLQFCQFLCFICVVLLAFILPVWGCGWDPGG